MAGAPPDSALCVVAGSHNTQHATQGASLLVPADSGRCLMMRMGSLRPPTAAPPCRVYFASSFFSLSGLASCAMRVGVE